MHHELKPGRILIFKRGEGIDARQIDQQIDAAIQGPQCRVGHLLTAFTGSKIARQCHRPQLFGKRIQGALVGIHEHQATAAPGELPGQDAAHAASRAGEDDALVADFHAQPSFFRGTRGKERKMSP